MKCPAIKQLDTPRLILRKLVREDVPLFYERLGSSAEVTEHMLWQPHRDISESAASIEKVLRRYETGESCRWAITLRDDGELIGIIDLLGFHETDNICSFAYMLAQPFWNMGYGTEALKEVLRFAFTEGKAEAVIADHFAQNPASGAVMRKAGMVFRRRIPGKYEKNGILHDALEYGLTASQWRER